MKDGPAFQTYAADFYMDTAGWDPYAVGIYWRLLMYAWINEGLPQDHDELIRIGGTTKQKFEKFWTRFLCKKFQLNGNGNLINKRQEEVRENQRNYIESQRQKGFSSAKRRWGYDVTRVKSGLQPESNSSSSSSSLSNKEKNILSGKPDSIPFSEIISYLNQKTGKNFSFKRKDSQRHIRARWNEGRRLEDFKKVVDIKWAKWGRDEKMVDYLRPDTLFGSKMESYLQEESHGSGDDELLRRILSPESKA